VVSRGSRALSLAACADAVPRQVPRASPGWCLLTRILDRTVLSWLVCTAVPGERSCCLAPAAARVRRGPGPSAGRGAARFHYDAALTPPGAAQELALQFYPAYF